MKYSQIPCDYPCIKECNIKRDYMYYLEKNADKNKLTVALINNLNHEKNNLDSLSILNKSGLRQGQYYKIIEVPSELEPSLNENYFGLENLPLIYIPKKNLWGLKHTILYGVNGARIFGEFLIQGKK